MRVIFVFALWFSISFCSGQMRFMEIENESDFNNEDSLTYVHVYTDWCGLCKMMKQSIYPADEVDTYFSSHFRTMQWNPEKHLADLAVRWEIKQFPSFLIFNKEGKLFYRYSGVLEADELLKVLKTVVEISDMDLSEEEVIQSFDNIDAHGRKILMQGDIKRIKNNDRFTTENITLITQGMTALDMETFIEVTEKLERTALSFKQKKEIKTAISKFYSHFLKLNPSEEEVNKLKKYIQELSLKIRPDKL